MSGRLAFSPDGALLAAGGVLVDAADGRVLRVLRGHVAPVTGVAFSPGGTLLATGSFDGTARIWDVATGAVRAVLACHPEGVNDVAFAPDGIVLASGAVLPASETMNAMLWPARSPGRCE
jgi:WD40 repeat protein